MITPLLLIAVIVTIVSVTQMADLRRQYELRVAMDGILTRCGHNTLEEVALAVRENRHYLGRYAAWAAESRRAGDHHEAVRRMRLGCQAVEDLAPHFDAALAALRRLARSVSAIVAVPPVSAAAFRSWRLRGVAAAGMLAHELFVTGRQRMLVRLRVVAAVFRVGVRRLRVSTERVARRDDAREWRHIDALVADLHVVGDETLVAARRIVEALDAAELGCAAVRRVSS